MDDSIKVDGSQVEDLSLLGRTKKEVEDINKKFPNKPVKIVKSNKSKVDIENDKAVMTSIFDLGLAPDMLAYILNRLRVLDRQLIEFDGQKRLYKIRHNKAAMRIVDINIDIVNAQIAEVQHIAKMGARAEGVLVTKYLIPGVGTSIGYKSDELDGIVTIDGDAGANGIDKAGVVDVVLRFSTKGDVDEFIKQIREVKKYMGIKPVEDKKSKKVEDGQ